VTAARVTGDVAGLNPRLLERLDRLAQRIGRPLLVTSGRRSTERQRQLWDGAPANGLVRGVSVAPPGGSLHEAGDAADVTVNGVPIYTAVSSSNLKAVGLYALGSSDNVHVQLYPSGTDLDRARHIDDMLHDGGPLGIKKPGGPLGGTWIGDHLDKVGDATGSLIGRGVDAAGNATANAIVDLFASWWSGNGAKVTLYVALVVGSVAAAAVGLSRTFGLRAEVAT
jgi:hypothetical protein